MNSVIAIDSSLNILINDYEGSTWVLSDFSFALTNLQFKIQAGIIKVFPTRSLTGEFLMVLT